MIGRYWLLEVLKVKRYYANLFPSVFLTAFSAVESVKSVPSAFFAPTRAFKPFSAESLAAAYFHAAFC